MAAVELPEPPPAEVLAVRLSENEAVAVRPAEVPVNVMGYWPGVALADAVTVRVTEVELEAEKTPVTLAGKPAELMLTVPVKPFSGVMVMARDELAFWATLSDAAAGVMLKDGAAVARLKIPTSANCMR
jgi:hypothetical protein